MNRRHLFQLIGGAFAAAALELGATKPMLPRINPAYLEAEYEEVICFNSVIFQGRMEWKNEAPVPTGIRYNWTQDGFVEVDEHLGDSIAQEPNPSYVDSGE